MQSEISWTEKDKHCILLCGILKRIEQKTSSIDTSSGGCQRQVERDGRNG